MLSAVCAIPKHSSASGPSAHMPACVLVTAMTKVAYNPFTVVSILHGVYLGCYFEFTEAFGYEYIRRL